MKKIILVVVIWSCCKNVWAQHRDQKDSVLLFAYFKGNGEDGLHYAYSHDGYTWQALNYDQSFLTPAAGKDKLMRDPCIVRGGDGRFHMVWTVSWNEKGIGYASSKDLKKWSEQQYIPVMEHEPDALNCWAPEIFYNKLDRSYMIYWATSIPGRFPQGDTSGDGKYNHRMYYTVTKDFKHFTKAAVLYDKGFNVIDATIHKNGNDYIMFLKNETLKPVPEKNIRIAYSNKPESGYSDASLPISGEDWAEGPTAMFWKNTWWLYFDKYTQNRFGLLQSDDLKTWRDESARLQLPKGIRHGTVIKLSAKEFNKLAAFK